MEKCVFHDQLTEIPKHGSPWSLGLFRVHDLAVEKKGRKYNSCVRKQSWALFGFHLKRTPGVVAFLLRKCLKSFKAINYTRNPLTYVSDPERRPTRVSCIIFLSTLAVNMRWILSYNTFNTAARLKCYLSQATFNSLITKEIKCQCFKVCRGVWRFYRFTLNRGGFYNKGH